MDSFTIGVIDGLTKVAAIGERAQSGLRSAGLGLSQMADVPYMSRPDLPHPVEMALSNPKAAKKQLTESKKIVRGRRGRFGNTWMSAKYFDGGKKKLRAIEAARKTLKKVT